MGIRLSPLELSVEAKGEHIGMNIAKQAETVMNRICHARDILHLFLMDGSDRCKYIRLLKCQDNRRLIKELALAGGFFRYNGGKLGINRTKNKQQGKGTTNKSLDFHLMPYDVIVNLEWRVILNHERDGTTGNIS